VKYIPSTFYVRQNSLKHLVKNIERELDFPADIEWAFDADGKLWLLQARPITTIKGDSK